MSQPWFSKTAALTPLKRLAEIRLGKMLQSSPTSDRDRPVPYIRAGLLAHFSQLPMLPTMWATPSEIASHLVQKGDLVVAEGGDVGTTAFVPPIPPHTIIQNSLYRVRPRDGNDARYLKYCLEAIRGSGWLEALCNRATLGHLTREKLGSLCIPSHEPARQRAIAAHLDAETVQIDALIKQKNQMLQLLSERLQIIAHELTTSHGRTVPLRWLIRQIKTGVTPPADDLSRLLGGTVPWYSPGDVCDWMHLDAPERALTSEAIVDRRVPLFPADSSLVIGIGATAGRVAHLDSDGTGNQQMTCIVPGPLLVPRFLSWQLFARTDEMRAIAPFTTLPIINNDFLKSLSFVVPDIDQQTEMVTRLDREAHHTRCLSEKIKRQIALLRERRQALIAAAVTGELDIPGASP